MHNQAGVEEYDALTGLLSRNAGEMQIAEAIQENIGCLAFLDVDYFKKVSVLNPLGFNDQLLCKTQRIENASRHEKGA